MLESDDTDLVLERERPRPLAARGGGERVLRGGDPRREP